MLKKSQNKVSAVQTFAAATAFAAWAAVTAALAAARASQAASTSGNAFIFCASVIGLRSRLELMLTFDLTLPFPEVQAGAQPRSVASCSSLHDR